MKSLFKMLAGFGLLSLFSSKSDESEWEEVTKVAISRRLNESDVNRIVKLMEKCELIPREPEAAMRHPFIRFWLSLAEADSDVAEYNMEVLRSDENFMAQVERLAKNLQRSDIKLFGMI